MRGDYPSSSLIKSYTNMQANTDDGSLSTKDKSLPLKRSAIALSLKISVNEIQMLRRRSQNIVTCIVTCDCFCQKQSSRLSFNFLRGVLVYKIQQLLHSLIASLMWSFHCVDLVCWLARLLVGGKYSRPFHATQYVMLTYTFMLLLQ